MKPASIGELIRESTVFAMRGSNAQPQFGIADDLWNVEVDVGQIGQVINNLVINAVQAMPDGGTVTVTAENVHLEGEKLLPLFPGGYIRLSVADAGAGIHPDYLSRIFDPYFTTKQKGSGLGLAICYSIVTKHGGHISVDSSLGKGTAFHVYLPAVKEETVHDLNELDDPSCDKGKILFMDDEEILRRAVTRMLLAWGCEVECARDGSEAIEMYRDAVESGAPYDIVIMDLTVSGGMGGREAIQKLLEVDPGAVAIVSSGYSNDPIMANFAEYGFKGVITKPYTAVELRRVIIGLMKR
jgi:CheY-like chemotaxis protein